jgi:hypothetical protein
MKEILVAAVVVLLAVCGSPAQADPLIIGLSNDSPPPGAFTLTATSNDLVINTVNFTASGNDALSDLRLALQAEPNPVYHFNNPGIVIQSNSSETLYISALVLPNREERTLTITAIPEPATLSILAIGAIICLGRSRRKKAC